MVSTQTPNFFLPNTNSPMVPTYFKRIFETHDLLALQKILEKIPYEDSKVDEQNNPPGEKFNTEKNASKENLEVRISRVKWIHCNNETLWLFTKITNCIKEANNLNYNFDLLDSPLDIQYTEYHGNTGGKYDWHSDCGSGYPSWRKLSTSILISDPNDFEGGEFQMFTGGNNPIYTSNLNLCDMVVFPSYIIHRVAPLTKGIRRSLVMWVGGFPFR